MKTASVKIVFSFLNTSFHNLADIYLIARSFRFPILSLRWLPDAQMHEGKAFGN